MALLTLGVSHHTAPLAVREKASFSTEELGESLVRLRGLPGISEAALISTCNRTELVVLAAPEDEARLLEWWRRERQLSGGELDPHLFVHRDYACVLHNLRVACGLDSMVVGEPQILGQMKQSYALARTLQTVGPVLSRLFEHSFAVAKLVRTKTQIGAHPVTLAYAVVQLAQQLFSEFSRRTALVVGAGETAQLIARHLCQRGVGQLIIANRTLERAQRLAGELKAYAIGLADLDTVIANADVIVTSTGGRQPIISRALMERVVQQRRRRPVLMIDLAVPRDIDPAVSALEDVYLYALDDLREIISSNLKAREQAARQADALVESHAHEFSRWLDSRDAGQTIRRMRQAARAHRDHVLMRARRKLAAGAAPEEVLGFVADALANRLLHAPTQALRDASAMEQALLLSAATRLFDLTGEDSDSES